jgi:hypothetical protein
MTISAAASSLSASAARAAAAAREAIAAGRARPGRDAPPAPSTLPLLAPANTSVRALLQAADERGWTAAHAAAHAGDAATLHLLLSADAPSGAARLDARDVAGASPLALAKGGALEYLLRVAAGQARADALADATRGGAPAAAAPPGTGQVRRRLDARGSFSASHP